MRFRAATLPRILRGRHRSCQSRRARPLSGPTSRRSRVPGRELEVWAAAAEALALGLDESMLGSPVRAPEAVGASTGAAGGARRSSVLSGRAGAAGPHPQLGAEERKPLRPERYP